MAGIIFELFDAQNVSSGGPLLEDVLLSSFASDSDVTTNYDPEQPRDRHGRFSSGEGTATSENTESTDKVKTSLLDTLKSAASSVGHYEHVAKTFIKDKVAENLAKLPESIQKAVTKTLSVVTVGTKAAFATWTSSQALAERVSIERGSTPEEARRLRGILTAADITTLKPLTIALGASGIGATAIGLASFVPPATASYLAYSTARNPAATARAATGLVKDTLKNLGNTIARRTEKLLDIGLDTGLTANISYEHAREIARQVAYYNYHDWYIAVLSVAIDSTNTLEDAFQLANKTYSIDRDGPSDTVANAEGWVTLESGQHVYIGDGGQVMPSGPDTKNDAEASKPKVSGNPPKVVTSIKEMVDIQEKNFREKLESGGFGSAMDPKDYDPKKFKRNWNKTLKTLEADEGAADRLQPSIDNAYNNYDIPHVPIFIRKLTDTEKAIGENAHWDNGFIVFSDDVFDELNYRQSVKSLNDTRKFTVKEAYDDMLSGLLIHELGHKYHDDNPNTIQNARMMVGGTKEERRNISDRISGYAATNHQELIAESYAMSKHKDYSSLPIETRNLVEAVLSGRPYVVNTRWSNASNLQKLKAFQDWLRAKLAQKIVGMTQRQLWEQYAKDALAKGIGRSFDDYKSTPQGKATQQRSGVPVDPQNERVSDFLNGSRQEFLRQAFNQPVAVEKLQLLATRSYDDLANVTTDMSTRMSRVLVDGLAQGKGAEDVARDLSNEVDIGRDRALVIARTEIIRSHAEGQLIALENLGVEEIGVAVEWEVTDDPKLCPKCKALDGIVLKIEEASGIIPRHPNCRCAWIPANVGEDTAKQKRSKDEIDEAIEESDDGDEDLIGIEIDEDRPESPIMNENPYEGLLKTLLGDRSVAPLDEQAGT